LPTLAAGNYSGDSSNQVPDRVIDMTTKYVARHDGDTKKGAVESQSPGDKPESTNLHSNLADQLPHRNTSEWLDGDDSDFPEPGSNPEHSGQHS